MSDDLENSGRRNKMSLQSDVRFWRWFRRAKALSTRLENISEWMITILAMLSLLAFVGIVAPRVPKDLRTAEYGLAGGIIVGFHLGMLISRFFSTIQNWVSCRIERLISQSQQDEK